MVSSDDELVPTRRSLLSRLKRWDDHESWQQFFDTYWKLIYGLAAKAGLGDDAAQDVVQDTVAAVAKQMPRFKYDPALGSFKNWLFLIARRRIADHLRRHYRQVPTVSPAPDSASKTALIESLPDPSGDRLEAIWEEEWKHHLLHAALARVKAQVEPRHYQIFDCHVLKEWPVKDVVRTFGVRSGQVYVIKHRLSALLAREVRLVGEGIAQGRF